MSNRCTRRTQLVHLRKITSTEEFPDFVQQFAEKQDREEREEKIFAAKVLAGIAIAIGFIFYDCWKYYVG
ncbi:hypothetical protein I6E40_10580 [Prevotellamassilia timonensis]|nr:hypothetical protein [Prevotellamassilia timonensis]